MIATTATSIPVTGAAADPVPGAAPAPTPPALAIDLRPLLDRVGLSHAATALPAWLDRAAREELPYADFLQGLLEEEASARATALTQRRLREAGLPFAASIEQFDFRFRPELKRQVVLRYLDPTFVAQARSLALVGAPGLGKTMLAVCIATKQVQLGATAHFVTAQSLANQLGRAATLVGRQRLLKPLLACDVLVLDELGYLPTAPAFGPALYEVVAARYERRPTIITSNKSLPEWAAVVQDASLAAAIVDRILHHGDIFYLKGPSWRLKGRAVDDLHLLAPTGSGDTTAVPSRSTSPNNNNNRTSAAPA
jgi:DNA replication protein DnaC